MTVVGHSDNKDDNDDDNFDDFDNFNDDKKVKTWHVTVVGHSHWGQAMPHGKLSWAPESPIIIWSQ